MKLFDIFLRPLAKDKIERRIATFFSIRIWHFRLNVNTHNHVNKHTVARVGFRAFQKSLDFDLFNDYAMAEAMRNTTVNDLIGLGDNGSRNEQDTKEQKGPDGERPLGKEPAES